MKLFDTHLHAMLLIT